MTDATLAKIETPPAPVVQGESAALISMIERAARDPAVNIDKMERLFEMSERARSQAARAAYDAAFALMQPELPEIDKRGKIIIRDKHDRESIIQSTPYALWDDTNRMIKPILARYGFGLSFRITQTDARLTTTAVLSHVGGHREETAFSSQADTSGSKNNVQGWGSAFSYGKRYTGTAILNITTKGEDDDGNAAGKETVKEDTLAEIKRLIAETKADLGAMCAHFSVETLDDLTGKQAEKAKVMLIAKRAQMQKGARNG